MALGKNVLGIVLDDDALRAAELRVSGVRRRLGGVVEIALSREAPLDDPEALGLKLKAALREQGTRARRTVVGVPVRWLLLREKAAPPAANDTFDQISRLEAEKAFPASARELAVTYSDHPDASGGRRLLLAAMDQARLGAISRLARAAGLKLLRVTPTALALSSSAQDGTGETWTVYASEGSAELVRRGESGPVVVRRVPLADPARRAEAIGDGVRQVMALVPGGQEAGAPPKGILWEGGRNSAPAVDVVAASSGLRDWDEGDFAFISVQGEGERRFSGPAAVALSAQLGPRETIDFLHPRLAQRRRIRVGRLGGWGVAFAVALGLLALAAGDSWRRDQREIAQLRATLEGMRPDIEAAENVIERTAMAREWFDRRPLFLDSLREIALAFPLEGTVWATSIGLSEDMRAVISGKATNEEGAIRVRDRLAESPGLEDARLLFLRETGGSAQDLSFAIQLKFKGGQD